jgi:hypothetical protein
VDKRDLNFLQPERELIPNSIIGDENNVAAPEINEIGTENIDTSSVQEKSIKEKTRHLS